uniref:Uncharacterized protein n=1 Tax=Octopus bimaculoides TaxID=37653 RepID=A0A0L8GUV9_OCTBM
MTLVLVPFNQCGFVTTLSFFESTLIPTIPYPSSRSSLKPRCCENIVMPRR